MQFLVFALHAVKCRNYIFYFVLDWSALDFVLVLVSVDFYECDGIFPLVEEQSA